MYTMKSSLAALAENRNGPSIKHAKLPTGRSKKIPLLSGLDEPVVFHNIDDPAFITFSEMRCAGMVVGNCL